MLIRARVLARTLPHFWRVIHPRSETGSGADDTSKVPPDRNSDPTHVSAETSPAAGDHKVSNRKPVTRIERAIEAQREQLLQAHGVLTCLYEVLLYAEGDDAINYAQAAHAAARLVNKSVEEPGLSADQADDRGDRVQGGG